MRKLNLVIDDENKSFFVENDSSSIELREIANEVEDNYGGYITLASINNKLYELDWLSSYPSKGKSLV